MDILRALLARSEELNARVMELALKAQQVTSEERKTFLSTLQRLTTDQAELFRRLTQMIPQMVELQLAAERLRTAPAYVPDRNPSQGDGSMYG